MCSLLPTGLTLVVVHLACQAWYALLTIFQGQLAPTLLSMDAQESTGPLEGGCLLRAMTPPRASPPCNAFSVEKSR